MAQHYAAFVIRHLHHTSDDRRITIEHTKTGEVCTVTGVTAAIAWLGAHSNVPLDLGPDNAAMSFTPLARSR